MPTYKLPLFGFEIRTLDDKEKEKEKLKSPVAPVTEDGAFVLAGSSQGSWRTYVDQENRAKNEIQLITRYRDLAQTPEVDKAVTQIVNQAIVTDNSDEDPVVVQLDNVPIDGKIKERVREEFKYLLGLLDFKRQGYNIFKKWYVDGRLFYHIVIDTGNAEVNTKFVIDGKGNNLSGNGNGDGKGKDKKASTKNKNERNDKISEGIKDLRYVDPRKIKKVREQVDEDRGTLGFDSLFKKYIEYYVFNEKGIAPDPKQGLPIAKDSIAYIHSGIIDHKNGMVLSHLQKAIKIANNLQMLENSVVIYRLARAPERRVFYLDVQGMPPQKAEQYMTAIQNNFKNTLNYDNTTGEVITNKRFSPMLEDFFLARRSDGKATEITTLPAGSLTNQMDDVEYFKKKLYEALDVPVSRMGSESGPFDFGRPTEITRDEVDFNLFIARLRTRFSDFFNQLLEIQLSLKNVMTRGDFQEIKKDITYDFIESNFFTELKETEIFMNRVNTLQVVDAYLGKYFSKAFIVDKVLQMSEEEWDAMKEQIEEEKASGEITDQDMMQQGGGFGQPIYGQDFGGMDMGGGEMDGYNQQQLPPPSEEGGDTDSNVFSQRKRLAAEYEIDKTNTLIESLWEKHINGKD